MGTQHFLYVPVDPAFRREMEEWWEVDLSNAQGKVPDVDRLRLDLVTLYAGYDGGCEATAGGFDAKYTKCVREYEEGGRKLGEYDDLEFSYDGEEFARTNLISLGRHLPSAPYTLEPFLDLVERHFGTFYVFTDAEMRPMGRKDLLASYP